MKMLQGLENFRMDSRPPRSNGRSGHETAGHRQTPTANNARLSIQPAMLKPPFCTTVMARERDVERRRSAGRFRSPSFFRLSCVSTARTGSNKSVARGGNVSYSPPPPEDETSTAVSCRAANEPPSLFITRQLYRVTMTVKIRQKCLLQRFSHERQKTKLVVPSDNSRQHQPLRYRRATRTLSFRSSRLGSVAEAGENSNITRGARHRNVRCKRVPCAVAKQHAMLQYARFSSGSVAAAGSGGTMRQQRHAGAAEELPPAAANDNIEMNGRQMAKSQLRPLAHVPPAVEVRMLPARGECPPTAQPAPGRPHPPEYDCRHYTE